jgi:heat shock protein HslJ
MKRISLLFLIVLMLAAPGCKRGETTGTTPDETSDGSTDPRLSAYHWHLVDATSAAGERLDALFPNPERPVTLDFADGRVSVSNACNRMGGSFTVTDGAFSVGGLMQTEMACEAPLMRAESAIAGVLAGGGTLQLEADDVLVLTTPAGDTLRFRGEPTADTRFGTTGERVFFEVASQRVACHHAMMPDYQCLHIREVRYDDNGIVTGHGEWEFLYQDIEGYTHEPGVRNVVRVLRYQVANPPADGSSVAYVLDMVVESELE